LLNYGAPQGYLPLRKQLQHKLAELEIEAALEQIVTTAGVTMALDLVARELCRPGDTVCWAGSWRVCRRRPCPCVSMPDATPACWRRRR
jgi:hypothetical protein